jgi:hypothetical protein
MSMSFHSRRCGDTMLPAFRRACDQAQAETAEFMLLKMESAKYAYAAPEDDADRSAGVRPKLALVVCN